MSTNISKQKRDELLQKIQEIRAYISTAEQDENTARLLSYLSPTAYLPMIDNTRNQFAVGRTGVRIPPAARG